ncbi:MAG TPA: efflux RND transporter periplasmic adaptor subunit [Panacibacter sp.]|nr:efflux RND transporter periplasmic adaptor subunit [Panacibacter sp.]
MQKLVKIILFSSSLFLASCGAKTDDSKDGGVLTEKKAKLEELKKQQVALTADIAKLQQEIAKLDPSFTKPEKAKLVSIQTITTENFTHYIDLQGSINAEDISYIAPRNGQGGLVKAIYVKKGDYVKSGQLLLKLDDAVYLKNLKQFETQLSYAEDLYRRQKNLWDQQIGTELQLIQAKQNVDQLHDQISTIKEQWSMTSIYADVAGVADEVNVRVGELFSGFAGQVPQIRIVNNSRLKVTTQIPENYVSQVNVGNNIIISLPDIGKTINTRISLAGKTIDPASRSFYVEAKLPSDKDLRPNQIALVKIQDYAAANAVTAPVNTLQTDESGKFIMVAATENGKMKARKKPVEIGLLYADKIEIKKGLQVGDQIITGGFQGLFDGQLIALATN